MFRKSLCKIDAGDNPIKIVYVVRRKAVSQTFEFKQFNILRDRCIYDRFTYAFHSLEEIPRTFKALPTFISDDPSTLTFTLQTNDLSDLGTYKLALFGSLNPHLNFTHKFTLNVKEYPNTSPPYFKEPLVDPYRVSLQSDKRYHLPQIVEPDDETYSILMYYFDQDNLTLSLPSFVSFDQFSR
jgi:hypothetical protein